jgi:hypothetical protein
MTQNNGEHADIPELVQTPEAQRQTELTASIVKQRPTLGAVIDYYGRNLGVLAWFVNTPTGDMFANFDNGTLTTDPSGKGDVTVRIQNPDTGRVRTYTMPDVATAFSTLGLHAERCNGINAWREMELMPGTAGRD